MRAIFAYSPGLALLLIGAILLVILPFQTPIPCNGCQTTPNGTTCHTCVSGSFVNVYGLLPTVAGVVWLSVAFAVRSARKAAPDGRGSTDRKR